MRPQSPDLVMWKDHQILERVQYHLKKKHLCLSVRVFTCVLSGMNTPESHTLDVLTPQLGQPPPARFF